MKRILASLLLVIILLLSLSVCAHAEARIDYVSNYAGILSSDEQKDLRDRAAAVSAQYDFGVYVVVVDDHTQYVNGSIEDFAEEIFHSYGLGVGETEEGMILAMSMKERDYDIYAHGEFGNYAFTDYGKEQLADSFLDNFRRNDWAGGFRDFIETSADMLQKAKDGNPVDIWIPDPDPVETGPSFDGFKAAISLAMGALFGGGAVGGMKRSMKTAVKQTQAENYIRGGVNLRGEHDTFVNRTVTRTRIRQENNSSSSRPGGGHFGGTTISGSHGGSQSKPPVEPVV